MTLEFTPTGGRRLAEVVAAQIEQDIITRGWPVGEVIGSEGDLIDKLGVSRAIFREAVRIIEHHNVARMRRGPGGGLVVTEPDSDAVQRAVALYLRFAGVGHDHLFATRSTLELACAAQAAENITEEGIERLRAVLALEEQLQAEAIPTGHTHDLHVVIADLTGNPVNTLFVRVLTELTRQQQLPHDDVDRAVSDYHHAHQSLVDAIVAGDPALAQHRMRRHLEAIAVVVGDTPVAMDPGQDLAELAGGTRAKPRRSAARGTTSRSPAAAKKPAPKARTNGKAKVPTKVTAAKKAAGNGKPTSVAKPPAKAQKAASAKAAAPKASGAPKRRRSSAT